MSILCVLLTACQRWGADAASTPDHLNSCQLAVVGALDGGDTVQQATVHCQGASAVTLLVDPDLEPFLASFTGDGLGAPLGTVQCSQGVYRSQGNQCMYRGQCDHRRPFTAGTVSLADLVWGLYQPCQLFLSKPSYKQRCCAAHSEQQHFHHQQQFHWQPGLVGRSSCCRSLLTCVCGQFLLFQQLRYIPTRVVVYTCT